MKNPGLNVGVVPVVGAALVGGVTGKICSWGSPLKREKQGQSTRSLIVSM